MTDLEKQLEQKGDMQVVATIRLIRKNNRLYVDWDCESGMEAMVTKLVGQIPRKP